MNDFSVFIDLIFQQTQTDMQSVATASPFDNNVSNYIHFFLYIFTTFIPKLKINYEQVSSPDLFFFAVEMHVLDSLISDDRFLFLILSEFDSVIL